MWTAAPATTNNKRAAHMQQTRRTGSITRLLPAIGRGGLLLCALLALDGCSAISSSVVPSQASNLVSNKVISQFRVLHLSPELSNTSSGVVKITSAVAQFTTHTQVTKRLSSLETQASPETQADNKSS